MYAINCGSIEIIKPQGTPSMFAIGFYCLFFLTLAIGDDRTELKNPVYQLVAIVVYIFYV
jgi:hypothetical protein